LCGSAQIEPRLVLTTFCRKCGEHLRIEKNGRVVASARINPLPSVVYPATQEETSQAADEPEPPVPLERERKPGPESEPHELEPMVGLKDLADVPSAPNLRRMGRPRMPAPPDPEEMLPRKRDLGGSRQHYFKEVECFDCKNHFKVGRSARSANCTSCGTLLCLEDVEINVNSTQPIRTRGDVLIRKNGNVQATEVRCRDLKLFGVLSAAIECSGEFYARATGTIVGEMRCHRLVIDKESDLHFMNSIYAGEVVVRGRILGQIQCTGAVNIAATGLVQGDVKARAVSIEPGGQLDGTMNIVQAPSPRENPAAARHLPGIGEGS
jgi:cytoskeletal protein CcmA (bactofilin family)/ribosomal protein S27E